MNPEYADAAEQDVKEAFIQPLLDTFGRPRKDQDEADRLIATYIDVLRGFTRKVLSQAAQKIIETRERRGWPLPAECKSVCQAVHYQIFPPAKVHRAPEDMNFKEREAAAEAVLSGPHARRAAEEGWLYALYTHAHANGVPPKDIESFRAAARQQVERRRLKLEGGQIDPTTRSVYETSERRERDLCRRVLGTSEFTGESNARRNERGEEEPGTAA